ncbi:MAG: phosphopantetheine-binding protein, partial [Myxococcota bacterium]
IGGAGVARGYVARPGLTASRFLPDPFAADPGARMYRTGDRVYRNLDGTLVFLGRTDLQFKLRGFRIEPGEIEAALEAHPAVSQAAVAKWSQGSDERLIAYLVPERGRRPDTGELRQFVRARMVPHQCPSTYVFLRALPISANGKLDRSALPEPDLQRPEVMSQFVAPRGDTEQELAAMWSQLLGVERVGADDHFFDLGGHSLLLVQLISLIRERFHCTLRVTEFFKHSTVRTLAERIAAERGGVSAKAASRDAGAADQRATERANARNRSRGSGAERRAAARSARRTGPRGGESR